MAPAPPPDGYEAVRDAIWDDSQAGRETKKVAAARNKALGGGHP